MDIKHDAQSTSEFSWQRIRTTEELGDFIATRLQRLEHVALELE